MSKYKEKGEKRTQKKRKKEKVRNALSRPPQQIAYNLAAGLVAFAGAAVTGRVGVLGAEPIALATRSPPLALFQRPRVVAVPAPGVVLVVIIIVFAVPRPARPYSGLPCPAPVSMSMPVSMPAMRTRHRRNITQRPDARPTHAAARPAASSRAGTVATRRRSPPRADPPDARRRCGAHP
jgi:hypothetical protein